MGVVIINKKKTYGGGRGEGGRGGVRIKQQAKDKEEKKRNTCSSRHSACSCL
jgi:hypothetical protein